MTCTAKLEAYPVRDRNLGVVHLSVRVRTPTGDHLVAQTRPDDGREYRRPGPALEDVLRCAIEAVVTGKALRRELPAGELLPGDLEHVVLVTDEELP